MLLCENKNVVMKPQNLLLFVMFCSPMKHIEFSHWSFVGGSASEVVCVKVQIHLFIPTALMTGVMIWVLNQLTMCSKGAHPEG